MADEMTEGQSPEQEGDGKETALLPSSLFGGDCKVGDTYTIKVVGKFDDQLEIEHVSDKKEESEDDTMAGADKAMDAMAQPGEAY